MMTGDAPHRAEQRRVKPAGPAGKLRKGQAERLSADVVRKFRIRPQAALHLCVFRKGVVLVAIKQRFTRTNFDAVFHATRGQQLSGIAGCQRVVIQGKRLPRLSRKRDRERNLAPHAVRQLIPAGIKGGKLPVRLVLMQSGNEERQHCHGQQQGGCLCGAPQGFVFHDCSSVRSSS